MDFKEWIDSLPEVCEARSWGMSDAEIADMLYEDCIISYIERDMLKNGEY